MHEIFEMDRRSLLGRIALLVGASVAGGLSPAALAQTAAAPKRFLDPARFALLEAVSETIVPRTDTAGAIDAKVPQTVDALLADWASAERRAALIGALGSIDAKAKAQGADSFAAMPPQARYDLLAAHDAEALKAVPSQGPALTGLAAMRAGPAVVDPAYAKLKELIVLAYYMSEPALTQELTYEHAPGEWQPSIPVTPSTRPEGGGAY